MKTVGEILKNARKQKHLSITQVASLTKIQCKFIKALEENDYSQLPESAFVKGFIRNYAQTIGQDPKMLLAVFRRDFSQDNKGKVIPRGLSHPLNQPKIRWTPKTTAIAFASILITSFLAYLLLQFRLLSGVPSLKIKTPTENEVVSSLVTIEGTTSPQATVTINSQQIEVSKTGYFTQTINLSPGKHTITIQSKSRTGKTKTIQRTVIVNQ